MIQIKYPRRPEPDIQTHLSKSKPQPWGLCDPQWQYVPAASTDVQKTWREHGWKPQGEKQ